MNGNVIYRAKIVRETDFAKVSKIGCIKYKDY